MNFDDTADIVGELTSLKFFPGDPAGRLAIIKLIAKMASNRDQVEWLVNRMLQLFDEWPGPRTLRMVFCKKFKPLDGIDICGFTGQYPEGIPDEKRIEAPPLPALPPGHKFSADQELEVAIRASAERMPKMPTLSKSPTVGINGRFVETLRETVTAPCDRDLPPGPPPGIISKADLNNAEREYRRAKAKEKPKEQACP